MNARDHQPQPDFPSRSHSQTVTPEGTSWLASSSASPRSTQALWADRPSAPMVLPCGGVFDAVSLSVLPGRQVLEQLWTSGPGSGPAATHRGRVLLLTAPGTALRLPSLTAWEEWSSSVPPVLCHGPGDAITVPPLSPGRAPAPSSTRWLVAPATRDPWLPSADVILWACLRTANATGEVPADTDFVGTETGC
jgi:hypothetical protein